MKSCVAAGVVLTMSLGAGLLAEARTGLDRAAQTGSTPQASGVMKVHVEGCVFPKRALSSMQPVIVPAGSVEDYVLTDIKVIAMSPGMDDVAGQTFALQEVAQDRLRELIGARVGVTGRIEDTPDAPRLHVVSIREISGTCPERPTAHS